MRVREFAPIAGLFATWVVLGCASDTPDAEGQREPVSLESLMPSVSSVTVQVPPEEPIGRVYAIRTWHDRLVVLDAMAANLRVLDRNGRLLMTLGQAGDGPGEFRSPGSATVLEDGRLVVLDHVQMRVSYFDTFGNYGGGWNVPGFVGSAIMSLHEGSRLVVASFLPTGPEDVPADTGRLVLHVFDQAGRHLDSFGRLPVPIRRYEGSFNRTVVTMVGATTVYGSIQTNVVHEHDLRTGAERSVAVGSEIYRAPEFPTDDVRSTADIIQWAQTQMWLQALVPVDSVRYLARFVTFDSTVSDWYHYALASVGGGTIAVTEPTQIAIDAADDGLVFGHSVEEDGDIRLHVLRAPGRDER